MVTKDTKSLKNTMNQVYLTDVYGTLYLKTEEYTYFLSTHRTFTISDHMSSNTKAHNKLKKIKIIQSIFSNHSGMDLELSNRRKIEKFKIYGN